MSNIKIQFHIDNIDKECFEDALEIEGGLSIEKDGLILTKRIDDEKDNGFRGDYVFFNLKNWLTSVPKLIFRQWCKINFYESTETFLFLPNEDVIYFKYFLEGIGSLTEDENKSYPNYEDGTPIAKKELIPEIINVSEKFIEIIELKIKNKSDVIGFKKELLYAKKLYKEYLEGSYQFIDS